METPTGTPSGARAAEDVGPYHAHMVPARSTHPMVGRDVLGAPRTWKRHGDAIRRAGRRGRRPLPRAHGAGPKYAPHGRARRPRRAAYMETPTGTPSGARAAEDVGPYHGITWCRPVPRTHPSAHGVGSVSASRAEGGAGTSRASPSATGCRNPKVSRRRRKRSQTSRSQNEKSDIIAP